MRLHLKEQLKEAKSEIENLMRVAQEVGNSEPELLQELEDLNGLNLVKVEEQLNEAITYLKNKKPVKTKSVISPEWSFHFHSKIDFEDLEDYIGTIIELRYKDKPHILVELVDVNYKNIEISYKLMEVLN